MRKPFTFALALLCIFSLAACSMGNERATDSGNSGGTPSGAPDDGAITDNNVTVTATVAVTVEVTDNNNVDASLGKAASYAEAYDQLTKIQTALESTAEGINEKHNENLEPGDPEYTGAFLFYILASVDMSFTATLSEDPAAMSTVQTTYGFFGLEANLEHPRANEYIITYTSMEGELCEDECRFDAETGSLSFVQKRSGATFNFYEFINLGGDRYAFQTNTERAVVTCKDGAVSAFSYSAYDSWIGDNPYDHASASIFPGGGGADDHWVYADGLEQYRIAYRFDGSTLKIDANPGYGSGTHVVITI